DVGGEPDLGILLEGDDGDDVGWIEAGEPGMRVDRVSDDDAPSGDGGRLRGPAAAARADRYRRRHEGGALPPALGTQPAGGARGPEPLVGGCELGERPHASYLGAKRWPPSRRIVPPFSIGVSKIAWARRAYSSGFPMRLGKAASRVSVAAISSGIPWV